MGDRRPIIPRRLAAHDIEEALAHYLRDADQPTALRFVDALEAAFELISRNPGIGSPRYAVELDIPGLRSWPLSSFPHLVFYVDRDDHVDVWRGLHARRDIPMWMAEEHDS